VWISLFSGFGGGASYQAELQRSALKSEAHSDHISVHMSAAAHKHTQHTTHPHTPHTLTHTHAHARTPLKLWPHTLSAAARRNTSAQHTPHTHTTHTHTHTPHTHH
jgi:hypothetical protein